ncbi:MAG TPA: phosphoglycerate mutase family protein [Kofleriaceae bacterium]|nr:phosphoglycerate mutase family protein [Kofleriaceae bacterium]
MKLYLMRHAPAHGDRVPDPVKDAKRPITLEGERIANAVAEKFDEEIPRPYAIYYSPYLRAQETAEVVGKVFGVKPQEKAALKDTSEYDPFVKDLLADKSNKRVMLVGHHGRLEHLMALLGDIEKIAQSEIRRYSLKRDLSKFELLDQVKPSDVGFADKY